MNIIESLYYGEINPFEKPYNPSKEFLSEFRIVENSEEKLLKSLSEENLSIFKEYSNAVSNMNSMNNLESFSIGFRLGAQLMIDILLPPESNQ